MLKHKYARRMRLHTDNTANIVFIKVEHLLQNLTEVQAQGSVVAQQSETHVIAGCGEVQGECRLTNLTEGQAPEGVATEVQVELRRKNLAENQAQDGAVADESGMPSPVAES